MSADSSQTTLPSVPAIKGPDRGTLVKLKDVVNQALKSVAVSHSEESGPDLFATANVFSFVLASVAPPFMPTLEVTSATTGKTYTFNNPIRKTSLPSLEAAINAFEDGLLKSDITLRKPDPELQDADKTPLVGSDVCDRLLPFIAFAASHYYDLFSDSSPASAVDAAFSAEPKGLFELSASLPGDSPLRVTMLSKAQALTLVACSFLCLFPRIGYQGQAVVPCVVEDSDEENDEAPKEQPSLSAGSLPTVNCDELFAAQAQNVEVTKLHMLLIYFSEMQQRYVRGFGLPKGIPSAFAADHTGPSLIFLRHTLATGSYFFEKRRVSSAAKGNKNASPDSEVETPVSTVAVVTKDKPLLPLVMAPLSESIDDQHDVLRVDFANMTIGGGAMSYGCVQEEITFALCPELIATRVMNDDMGEREAIIMLGAEQFAMLKEGTYGFGMACDGPVPHPDEMLVSSSSSSIIAIDALDYRGGGKRGRGAQYRMKSITREMIKFAAGVAAPNIEGYCASLAAHKRTILDEGIVSGSTSGPGDKSIVATGNWGCGVFLGDVEVKSLLQWIVCSECGKSMHYYPFDAKKLLVLDQLAAQLVAKSVTTRELFDFLATLSKRRRDEGTVFDALSAHFGLTMPAKPDVAPDNDTEVDEASTDTFQGEDVPSALNE